MPQTPADLAVSRGWISREQRDQAHLMAETSGKPVEEALVELGLVSSDQARELAGFKQEFGRYILEREVGRGGMGVVYKALQPELKRAVAIKVITSTSDEDLKRFRREAETAAKLQHPNIAPIYEVGTHDGRPFIAMAFIDGRTIGKSDLPLQRRIEALRDSSRALHFAHQQGIVHRDVKPDNIMIDRGGRAWVMDFGLAKSVKPGSSLTVGGIVMGTPSYMSPEQAQGRARALSPRSDVYSLGATLYEMLTGLPPFIAEDFMQVLLMVLKDEPEPPRNRRPGIPADLGTICLKALQKAPAHRYASADEFGDDLDRWLKGEPILARRSGALSRATARMRRQPLLVAAVVLLVGVIATASVMISRAQRRADDTSAKTEREREAMTKARPVYDAGLSLLESAESLSLRDPIRSVKRAEEALSKFVEATTIAPSFGDAWHARGRARALCEKDAKLVDADFAKAAELNPGSPRVLYDWGLAVLRDRLLTAEVFVPVFYDDPKKAVAPQPMTATVDSAAFRESKAVALRCFRDVAALAAKPDEKHFADGVLAYLGENNAVADVLFSRVLGVDDRHFWARTCRGFARVRAKQWPTAMVDLAASVTEKRAFARSRLFRSIAAQYAGEWAVALDDVDWLIADEREVGEMVRLMLRRGMLLKFAGRADEALKAFEEIIRASPDREEPYVFRARIFAERREEKEAVAEYDRLLARLPKCHAALAGLGLLALRARAFAAARGHFEAAVASDPSDPWPWYHLGKIALATGGDAREPFAKFTTAKLEGESAHHEALAHLAVIEGKPRDAIGHLMRAQELAPEEASLWVALGRVNEALKDAAAAYNAFYEAVRRNGADYDARLALALHCLARDLDDKAEGELTMAVSLRDTAEARFHRGEARRKMKRFEQARTDYEEARKDPAWKTLAEKRLSETK